MKVVFTCAALVLTIATISACGGDDDSSGDERVGKIGGVAELATYAYASAGTDGLYDYLAPVVTEKCTKAQLADDLGAEPAPSGFRGMEDVKFDGDQATATVIQIFRDHDENVEWTFVETDDGSWRISGLPGLEDCAG